MRRLYILIAVAVVGVLLVPGVAGSAAKKKRAVDVTAKAAIVAQAGGVNTVAGSLTGKPAGPGAVVYKARARAARRSPRRTPRTPRAARSAGPRS